MAVNIWINRKVNKLINNIAFIPSLVILIFLTLSISMIYFDFSAAGKDIKSSYEWIRLKDPSTARSIVSVVIGGLFSLTVFSLSMVMIVLNQAASQLSNRILDKLVGNKFHQFIIGFYIGVIIFGMLLLTSIRDIDSGVYVPALSTYFLIVLSIVALIIFILFLNSITQTIKYTTIIRQIFDHTLLLLKKTCFLEVEPLDKEEHNGMPVFTKRAGIFETFDRKNLLSLTTEHNCLIKFNYPTGHFVLQDVPIVEVSAINGTLTAKFEEDIRSQISLVGEASINAFFYSGFKQLSEIAIKALSPGINDPGTASESLQALFILLTYRINHFPEILIKDSNEIVRVMLKELTFDEIFDKYILPIWDYGKADRTIQHKMHDLIVQLNYSGKSEACERLLTEIQKHMNQ